MSHSILNPHCYSQDNSESTHLRKAFLRSKLPHSVIIKCPYIMQRKENLERDNHAVEEIQGLPYLHYTLAKNLQKLHHEANML
ncbi:hypothetical protein PAXRUDRAFT_17300 [Paxillus rubicundulus Ve08.2h10]|uniref:Uncharacterized protein n=1 Tax=Paxillus rubicundulus Ve08.2h10 TaxID=930991 RepID=A0A0D0D2H0_9AGAM|nr:hypothetical protein PAXRUDRAFT_17300 [Paxillus rubicundulus Ve08.2h10]